MTFEPASAETGDATVATPPLASPAPSSETRRRKLAALFQDSYVALVRYATSLNHGDVADAEDVVGDTFVVLANTRGDLLDDGDDPDAAAARVEHYLYNSVRNRVRNSRRDQTVRERYTAQGGGRLQSERVPRPDEVVEHDELQVRYRAALAALPPRQATVYRLIREDGWTSASTAAHLQISEGAVKTHLRRAVASLTEALAPWL